MNKQFRNELLSSYQTLKQLLLAAYQAEVESIQWNNGEHSADARLPLLCFLDESCPPVLLEQVISEHESVTYQKLTRLSDPCALKLEYVYQDRCVATALCGLQKIWQSQGLLDADINFADLYVEPEFRGKGYGKILCTEAMKTLARTSPLEQMRFGVGPINRDDLGELIGVRDDAATQKLLAWYKKLDFELALYQNPDWIHPIMYKDISALKNEKDFSELRWKIYLR